MSLDSQIAGLKGIDAPIIACDLDDVLSASNLAVAGWHNRVYGTSMQLSDFLYYYYWRNPFWGTPDETTEKVNEIYKSTALDEAIPVEGALEGVKALKKLGFALVVLTARQVRERDRSMNWLERHYPGLFETMICTGQSQETIFGDGPAKKLSKAGVCKDINARILIDDSIENGYACATAEHPVTTLLFGDYQWNKRRGKIERGRELSYEEKTKLEGGREWWKDDDVVLPTDHDGTPLHRVKDWEGVVEFVKKAKDEGRM